LTTTTFHTVDPLMQHYACIDERRLVDGGVARRLDFVSQFDNAVGVALTFVSFSVLTGRLLLL